MIVRLVIHWKTLDCGSIPEQIPHNLGSPTCLEIVDYLAKHSVPFPPYPLQPSWISRPVAPWLSALLFLLRCLRPSSPDRVVPGRCDDCPTLLRQSCCCRDLVKEHTPSILRMCRMRRNCSFACPVIGLALSTEALNSSEPRHTLFIRAEKALRWVG